MLTPWFGVGLGGLDGAESVDAGVFVASLSQQRHLTGEVSVDDGLELRI